MARGISKAAFILAIIIAMSMGAFASVNYLRDTIASDYSGGDIIRGNLYLRLNDHPSNVLLTSNFIGNITLLDLILNQTTLNEITNYNCSTPRCIRDYSSSGAASSVSVTTGQDAIAGFMINGDGITIRNAQFTVSSNAPSSCTPNLYIDILNDELNPMTNTRSSGESCGIRHTGCYNQQNSIETEIVADREYCEKITIPASPAILAGGKIRQGTSVGSLNMKLYTLGNSLLGNCTLPQNSQPLEELSCIINHSSAASTEYYVCITASTDSGHKIGWETASPTCGTAQGFSSLNSDFDIFAETIRYSASPSFTINETSYSSMFGLDLSEMLDAYIEDRYGRNCENGCFIPVRFFGEGQSLQISDSRINYDVFGVPNTVSGMHSLAMSWPRITAGNLSLDISAANLTIPIESNVNRLRLFIDGNEILSKNISVRRSFAFDVNPKFVAFGQNAVYRATSTSVNITSTAWNFGDGSGQQRVNGSAISHIYTRRDSPSFDIAVSAAAGNMTATRQFRILVGEARDIANQTIAEYKTRVSNVTSQINSYPSWAIAPVQRMLDLGNLSLSLSAIEGRYAISSSETEYQNVMLELLALDIPKSLTDSNLGNIPLSVGYENVNVNYLETIENEDIEDNSLLREQAVGWMNENFNPEISSRKITKAYDFDNEPLATIFTIRTNPITNTGTTAYLIFGHDIENGGVYKADYNVDSVSGSGVDYLILDTGQNQIFEFIIEGDIEAETLGAYIAPSLDAITINNEVEGECNINNICEANENANSCPEDCSTRWVKFTIIGWIIIGIAGIVAYIILQEWYKHSYQKSLFKDSNELYNLVNFIYNGRKSGLGDHQIKERLLQSKWSSEKIHYAFKKIEGKRVGMFEIPIFTAHEHRKTVAQIANRQGSSVDARFIKRPSFRY